MFKKFMSLEGLDYLKANIIKLKQLHNGFIQSIF
jgi:hypothetical protein